LDWIPDLIRVYQSRTQQLVIAYNRDSNPTQPPSFGVPLIPYDGVGAKVCEKFNLPMSGVSHPMGTVWRAWVKAAEQFPDVAYWVIHDYDVVCLPDDATLVRQLPSGTYGMIGQPIPRYKKGMRVRTAQEISPFTHSHHEALWNTTVPLTKRTDRSFLDVLEKHFPSVENGVETVLCGYGDIIVAPAPLIRRLGQPPLDQIEIGGIEQVIHSVAPSMGYRPYDLSNNFRTDIQFRLPIWFSTRSEIIHPVKSWSLMESRWARYKHFLYNAVMRVLPVVLPAGVIRRLSRLKN